MNGTLTDLNHLLKSDQLFEIPIFQRGYAWEEENLRDLWDDLDYLGDRKHYFGTILLKETNKTTEAGMRTFEHFEVIDGQQRLTTTLILLRELISQIREFGDDETSGQASRLIEDYIVYQDQHKLTIANEDRSFFRDSILGTSATDPQTRAQTRLKRAHEFFRDQFNRQRQREPADYVEFLKKFKRRIDRLEVMLYIVRSAAEAVRMFETVNDRGRPLNNLEKTKSILMYASYLVVGDRTRLDTLLSELNEDFSKIYGCFQDIEDGLGLRDAGEVQRYHHIFFIGRRDPRKHMQVLKDRLMRKSREDKKDCEAFIRSYSTGLRQAFEVMRDIAQRRRAGDMPGKDGKTLGESIDRLFWVGRVGNLYPLLIAAWQKFEEESQRNEILRLFEAYVFRVYLVVGYRSHTGRSWLNGLARRVYRDDPTFADFIKELREINLHYVMDDVFRGSLAAPHRYAHLGTHTIKYLLAQYENKLRENAGEKMRVSLAEVLSSEFETEHILPQHPAWNLNVAEKATHEAIVHRLGNLTIASKEWNQSMGNRPFEEKRDGKGKPEDKCYRNSSLRVQKNLERYPQWNEATIQERGAEIIDFALERWRVGPEAGSAPDAPQP